MHDAVISKARGIVIWAGLLGAMAVPLGLAATSPLLAWRDPIYIAAGFAGVVAMALLLVQPLLAAGLLPWVAGVRSRQAHRRVGGFLILAVVVHVLGLWITSPPDVIDALLFTSPTPFSVWGVMAMWALFAAALLAMFRRKLRWRLLRRGWRGAHAGLAVIVVLGSVLHAVLIDGTMETVSKLGLCALVGLGTCAAIVRLRIWTGGWRERQ